MAKKIFQTIALRLGTIFLLASGALLIDQLQRNGYLFDFRDLFVFRPTHEKFMLLFFLGGLYIQRKQKRKGYGK